MRKFEIVTEFRNHDITIPSRASTKSAGYDFAVIAEYTIKPGKIVLVSTGLRVKMPEDEVLFVFPRSSLGIKKGLMMSNGVGVIDADYYDSDNEGHIMIPLYNFTDKTVYLKPGERVAQGVFTKFFKTQNDNNNNITRSGGFGSSGK